MVWLLILWLFFLLSYHNSSYVLEFWFAEIILNDLSVLFCIFLLSFPLQLLCVHLHSCPGVQVQNQGWMIRLRVCGDSKDIANPDMKSVGGLTQYLNPFSSRWLNTGSKVCSRCSGTCVPGNWLEIQVPSPRPTESDMVGLELSNPL